jgi:hypothetical protein
MVLTKAHKWNHTFPLDSMQIEPELMDFPSLSGFCRDLALHRLGDRATVGL